MSKKKNNNKGKQPTFSQWVLYWGSMLKVGYLLMHCTLTMDGEERHALSALKDAVTSWLHNQGFLYLREVWPIGTKGFVRCDLTNREIWRCCLCYTEAALWRVLACEQASVMFQYIDSASLIFWSVSCYQHHLLISRLTCKIATAMPCSSVIECLSFMYWGAGVISIRLSLMAPLVMFYYRLFFYQYLKF